MTYFSLQIHDEMLPSTLSSWAFWCHDWSEGLNGGLCYGSVDQDGGNESKSSAAPKVGPFAAGGAGVEEGFTMAAAAATTAEEAKTKDDQEEEEVCVRLAWLRT